MRLEISGGPLGVKFRIQGHLGVGKGEKHPLGQHCPKADETIKLFLNRFNTAIQILITFAQFKNPKNLGIQRSHGRFNASYRGFFNRKMTGKLNLRLKRIEFAMLHVAKSFFTCVFGHFYTRYYPVLKFH